MSAFLLGPDQTQARWRQSQMTSNEPCIGREALPEDTQDGKQRSANPTQTCLADTHRKGAF